MLCSEVWSLLGPFQIGTREGAWGSDPLECFGGFHALERNDADTFSSALAPDGKVQWSNIACHKISGDEDNLSANLTIDFDDVDWKMMQSVYGWAALQYQTWIRGKIYNNRKFARVISLSVDNVLEFWVDERRYFGGDFYAYRRCPLFLNLSPGPHMLELRLVRDVRAMGATPCPPIYVHIDIKVHVIPLYVHTDRHHLPDIVVLPNGELRLPSPASSILVSNTTEFDIDISHLSSASPLFDITYDSRTMIKLAAGQTRSIVFSIALKEQPTPSESSIEAQFVIHIRERAPDNRISTIMFSHIFKPRSVLKFHKATYLNPNGAVAYSMLRAPPRLLQLRAEPYPVLVFLHGAGVHADSDQAVRSLDGTEDLDAWLLISEPSTTWGDDFHEIGTAGVKAGVKAIQYWIENIGYHSCKVDLDTAMIIGHSNGGQGAWYLATHWPDFVFALAVVSGYSSIQAYVPFQFWRETSPYKRAILNQVLLDYRHEILVPNVTGIPIFQQHGADDDNVPVYHARRMSELLRQANWSSDYNEIAGGHWFDGIMTTEGLKRFYDAQLHQPRRNSPRSRSFEFIVSNPGCTGPKNGINVDELSIPGQLGVLRVHFRTASSVIIKTENIKRLSFSTRWADVDDATIDAGKSWDFGKTNHFPISLENIGGLEWKAAAKRESFHLGGLHAILRTKSPLAIVNQDTATRHISHQIARNILQYFAIDSEIVEAFDDIIREDCNAITVIIGGVNDLSTTDHAITFPRADQILIEAYDGTHRSYSAQDLGLGCIFLRSISHSRLELVVWGSDLESLMIASRLVPTTTGIGQPDFIILNKSVMWKGIDGVLALGFFDSSWKTTMTSWFT